MNDYTRLILTITNKATDKQTTMSTSAHKDGLQLAKQDHHLQ